jgi:hypothetical protein
VGQAHVEDGQARVPFRLHQHVSHGPAPVRRGAILLTRRGTGWTVSGVDLSIRLVGDRVPSEGGAPPSRAPLRLWLGSLALGVALTAVSYVALARPGRDQGPASA